MRSGMKEIFERMDTHRDDGSYILSAIIDVLLPPLFCMDRVKNDADVEHEAGQVNRRES